MKEMLSGKAAAKILGVAPIKLKKYILMGIWNFGEVISKDKTGKKQDDIIVYRSKLEKHIGRKLE